MKFCQLMEYNMRNIFLEKSYLKYGKNTTFRPFSKSKNWAYLQINSLSFIRFVFIVRQAENCRTISKFSWRPPGFTSYKTFLKNKKRSGTSLPTSFSTWFLKKNIYIVIFYYLTKFHCLVAFTSWDIVQYVLFNCLLIRLWLHKFWN